MIAQAPQMQQRPQGQLHAAHLDQARKLQGKATKLSFAMRALCEQLEAEADGSTQKAWRPPRDIPKHILPRTRKRLATAADAFDAGDYSACVALIRVAVDTAARETIGQAECRFFVRMVTFSVGIRTRRKRLAKLFTSANEVVHGSNEAKRHEAERLLLLVRVIGGRWVKQVFPEDGNVPADMPIAAAAVAEATTEELTTV
jgi:hypothetical protein